MLIAQACYLAVGLSSATSLYLLISLLGTALRKEAHAGFIGAAIATLWAFAPFLVPRLLYESGRPEVAVWVDVILPRAVEMHCVGGVLNERGLLHELWISTAMLCPLLIQGGLQFLMAAWFVRRYSRRIPGRVIERVRKAPSFLSRPHSFPLYDRSMALAWLTLRQSLPMCLPGLLIACLLTPLLVLGRFTPAAIDEVQRRGELLQYFAEGLPESMLAIGLLWAVVVGAGIFSAEIDWKVGEFWRTRPILAWQLFAVKFLVGLLAVLLVLDATTIAIAWSFPNWNVVRYRSLDWAYVGCIVPLHAVMFAMAVAWTCLLRRPVFGAVAAVVSFAIVEEIIHWSHAIGHSLDPILIYENILRGGNPAFAARSAYPVVAAAMGVTLVALVLIAVLALRRYDPRRQTG